MFSTHIRKNYVLEQCHYLSLLYAGRQGVHAQVKVVGCGRTFPAGLSFDWLPIEKIRFTGGEPLLRQDLPDILAAWRGASGQHSFNGDKLKGREAALQAAGLTQLTFHLDTLRPEAWRAHGAGLAQKSSIS